MSREQNPYVRAAIDGELARLASAVEGTRNQTLFSCTSSLGSLGLREGEILHLVKPVADSIGLRGRELYATVKSGVKAGSSRPRQIPNSERRACASASTSQLISAHQARDIPGEARQQERPHASFITRSDGPPVSADEVRRHVYRQKDVAVRIKIKRASGRYVNWYRATRGGLVGWQAAKPESYEPCPYVGSFNPFGPTAANEPVFWPEGEKDCDLLDNAGMPAFTFGGTGDGLPEGVADYLQGRDIVIFADNDQGGREHAIRKAALAYAVARSVKLIEFPELSAKGDVSDYLQANSVSDLKRRVSEAPFWTPSNNAGGGWRNSVITASALKTKTFSPVKYVLPGYIPEGVTIFAGKPKIGKSWLLYDICLATAADRFVLGEIKPAQGDVLYLALEDSERRLQKRLKKLWPDGDWPARLTLATEWKRADQGGLEEIAEWCDSVANPVLVVVDTLEKLRPAVKSNSAAYSTDYLAIAGLHKLAHSRGIAVVAIHHVRKMEAEDPFDMVSGTNGLTGAADTILVLKRQAGNVTLYARGRDIEEKETACQFNKNTCRWTILGEAEAVHSSAERMSVMAAISEAGEDGLHTTEIMAAIQRSDRNAIDQLLYKMHRDGEVMRLKRGLYTLPERTIRK